MSRSSLPGQPDLTQHTTMERLRWSPEPAPVDESAADRAVRLACLTFGEDSPEHWAEAGALVRARPELLEQSIALAAACASTTAVRRHLDRDPETARQKTGPHGWSPLLYLAYSRIADSYNESAGDAAKTAELLLDAGADPNDGRYFLSLPTPFTVLTGVIGGGERDQPPHRQWRPLARLLLTRGAEANDAQALYNRMFTTDDDFLRLLLEFGLGRGDGGPWRQRLPELTPSPAQALRALLGWAITHDQRARVALLTEQGIDLAAPIEFVGPVRVDATPLQLAVANGHRELARQLREAGAPELPLNSVAELLGAALAGDVAAMQAAPPEVVAAARAARPGLVVWAAGQGRVSAVELLVASGWDVNALARSDVPVEQPWETALHTAVERDDPELVRRLLALGADPQRHDRRFDATPAEWAAHLGRPDLLPLFESD